MADEGLANPVARIVIVDDEPVILTLLASVFEDDDDMEVVACASGTEALQAMAQGVEVLLTDKNLPDVGGLELAERAREVGAEVLIITGYASLSTVLAAMKLDVFDYIVKPPSDIFEVRRKVRQALDKLRMRRENVRLMADLSKRNTELEQALAEVKAVQAELIQSEKLAGLGTLAAGVAHEISSPLFGVMGLAEAITDEEDLSLCREYAKEIVDYSGAIKEIVVQLQGYARTAATEQQGTVDLGQAIQDAVKLISRSCSFDPACLTAEVDEGLEVAARSSEIQQVFVNLVKNATEAVLEHHAENPANGRVVVRATKSERWVEAEVRDNGPGIPSDQLGAIFDPFFTTKAPGRGTGLGLNIVYRIVTKYRGTVTVDSEEGKGAAFTVRFARPGPESTELAQ